MMLITATYRISILLISLLAAACVTVPPKGSPPPTRQQAFDVTNKEIALKQAYDSLMKGDYESSLVLYAETYRKHDEKDVRDKYFDAGNQVKAAADSAFENTDYAKAGAAYRALLNVMITAIDTGKTLSFDEDYLRQHLKACSDKLTEKGLTLYRQQNLNEAITTWKKVLTFDPGNKTVVKHIDTANHQLRNLKSLNE